MRRAGYEGIAVCAPITVPYVRYSIRAAHWFLAGALKQLIERAGIGKEQIDGLCVSSFTLTPDTAVGLTQHLGVTPRWLDAIAATGEILSSRLVAAALASRGLSASWVDARRVIVTTDEHMSAAPLMPETIAALRSTVDPLLASRSVPVIGGFVGATRVGVTTTLGRGGSDYSAALIASALGASELQIWTDVTGVMTCDPRICGEARTIPVLSYEEAAELAYFGAKVLHPKTIKPAVDSGIPVRVCNTFEPSEVGTMILAESGEAPNKIKSIAHKKNITILRISSARMLGAYGFMAAVFQVFERYRTVIDVVSTSEVSVALTLDNAAEIEKIRPAAQ